MAFNLAAALWVTKPAPSLPDEGGGIVTDLETQMARILR